MPSRGRGGGYNKRSTAMAEGGRYGIPKTIKSGVIKNKNLLKETVSQPQTKIANFKKQWRLSGMTSG